MTMKQMCKRSLTLPRRPQALAVLAFVAIATEQSEAFSPTARHSHTFTAAPAVTMQSIPTTLWSTSPFSSNEFGGKAAETTAPPSLSEKRSTDPTPIIATALQNMVKDPSAVIAATMLTLVLMLSPMAADAAMSGGRMGGSFSAPRQSSSRMMSPSRSYGGGYSRGYSPRYYGTRPGVTIAPTITPFVTPFASPFYNPFMPRPFFFGGPGVMTYNRGPSFFDLLFLGGLGFMITNAIRSARDGTATSSWGNDDSGTSIWKSNVEMSALGAGTSVVQVSVALEVPNRDDTNSILSALSRLARTSKTDSRMGIQNLTSQVALELLRRKNSIVSATTRYKHFDDRTKAQRDYNTVSIKERSKFEEETVSQYGGVDYSESPDSRGSGNSGKATMAVVTLILAIDGDSTKVPMIRSIQDVEEALRKIASDVRTDDCLQSAEILWTPEDRTESLTLREVVADYPELRSV
jgi:uncharacterized membrane protein